MNENKKLSRKVDKVIKDMAGSVNMNILSGPGKLSQQLQKNKKAYGAVAEIQEKIVVNLLKLSSSPLLMNGEAKYLAVYAHLGRFVSENV